jgi:signal transduction histidine kinase
MAQAVPTAPGRADDPDGSAMLGEMLDALGSELDLDGVVRTSAQVIAAVLGWELHAYRLAVPDASGDLRAVAGVEQDLVGDDSLEQATAVFDRKTTDLRPAPGDVGTKALTIPFVTDGLAYGVVDIVAPSAVIDGRRDVLDAVAGRIAVALADVTASSSNERDGRAMQLATAIVDRVAHSRTREEALREIVRGVHQGFGLRAAAWLREAGEPVLVSARGLGSRRRDRLRAIQPGGGDLAARLASTFASAASSNEPDVVDAGGAIIVMDPSDDPRSREAIALVQGVCAGLLRCLYSLEQLRRRNASLDDALTLTAHELRGPLLAAKATIDGMLQEPGRAGDDRVRLRGARRQLEELADVVGPLLRWSVSDERLRRRLSDLVGLVAKAIDSVVRETGEDRVILEVSLEPVSVPISRRHLSFAIANLIRNAIAFSPRDSVVSVRIMFDPAEATISVHDEGVGVPAEDLDSIFQPFARGRLGRSVRAGNGLGLFVVQRVADSHGGRVWVESGASGTTFHLTLPLRRAAAEGRVRHGSVDRRRSPAVR